MTTLAPAPPARTPVSATEHPTLRRFTVDEYHRLVGLDYPDGGPRTELIDGLIYAMAPFSPPHIAVVNRLAESFFTLVGDRTRVSVQNSVRLNDGTEPEPDIALLSRAAPEDRVPEARDVLLVVEIAVTTEAFDRNVKMQRYAAAGISEAWLVLPAARTVETFRRPGPGGYADAALHTDADSVDVLGAALAVRDIFPPAPTQAA